MAGLAGPAAGEEQVSAALKERYRRPSDILFPSHNAFDPAKAELGRTLFFDPRMSASGAISCASCHDPDQGWQDSLPLALGHKGQVGTRRTPPVANLAWATALMWDGRAATLEAQIPLPVVSPVEMAMPLDRLVDTIAAIPGYQPLFEQAFGDANVTEDRITAALATFTRTIISGQAPFDRWLDGDEAAMSAAAKRGFVLFNTKARCAQCHSGWRFTDDSFHDIGLPGDDLGRGALVPPEIEILQRAFKTPGLRDIAIRAPYMHDGSLPTLREVIDHYVDGGQDRASRSPEMKPVDLADDEIDAIIRFLEALTGETKNIAAPLLP